MAGRLLGAVAKGDLDRDEGGREDSDQGATVVCEG